jgi:hypothetical protein
MSEKPSWGTWYHGSPLELALLREGSTITRIRALAEAFSHKPAVLCVSDAGMIKHTGVELGYLYRIAEEVGRDDVRPIPGTTMSPGYEWHTTRPLRLGLIGRVKLKPEERLTNEEIDELRRIHGYGGAKT